VTEDPQQAEEEPPPKKSGGVLKRSTKVQLVLFVVITLLGVSYVGAEYVGLGSLFGSSGCTVHADFTDSGGIFSNAEVTYRGVTVGRVGSLHLAPDGVRVDLHLDDCAGAKIPASTAARVADRSVVGEQYVDLLPSSRRGPYLRAGDVIPASRTSIPTATQTLLTNIDRLVNSVDIADLQATIAELGVAFNDQGNNLAALLDATNTLVNASRANLPATVALIDQSAPVLTTQLDEGSALQSFVTNLDLLAGQLKASNGDITHLLDTGPADLGVLNRFIQDNRTDLAVVFANLVDIGNLLVRHKDGLEQILEFYPIVNASGPSVLHDNRAALGLVTQVAQTPPDCGDPFKGREGYQATPRRDPDVLTPIAPNVAARCTAPVSSGVNVRGSANVPGGDPISIPNNVPAYPRSDTDNILVDPTLQNAYLLGPTSWQPLLTDALH
jgi:phospholipid/cholesterol/gamma-HCH transport system substrate-binding protein